MSGVLKGGQVGECGVDGGGGWAADGRLNPPLGLLGLAMSPKIARHRPKHVQRA